MSNARANDAPVAGESALSATDCDFDHPHPEQPCGREVIAGVTRCTYCGNLDGSDECHCWRPATQRDLDELLCAAMELERSPRLLDLFCCAGGAAKGYAEAGFEVVGVDIAPQPNYPYAFVQMDALEALAELLLGGEVGGHRLADLDAIHASPPCQGYLNLGAVNRALGRPYWHDKLIEQTRALLMETGKPYVIENVADARKEMVNPVRVCGTALGLPLRRHRLFEANFPLKGLACQHGRFTEKRYWTGWRPKGEVRRSTVVQVYGNAGEKHEWPAAMGIDWMTYDELAEAVPPAYTEHIGRQLMAQLPVRCTDGSTVHNFKGGSFCPACGLAGIGVARG